MNGSADEELDIDLIIHKLRQSASKDIKLKESEIRSICIKARQIF